MTASFPDSAKTFTTKVNGVDTPDADHINDLQDEVTAIETEIVRSGVTISAEGGIVLPSFDGTTRKGVFYKDTSPWFRDFGYGLNGNGITPTGRNTFLGLDSGNFTAGSTATVASESSNNIGIGVTCLIGLTTGYSNFAFGNNVLKTCTSGAQNIGIGNQSLYSLTTGTYNISIGNYSGWTENTGSNNLFIGRDAGRYATGSSNVFLGYKSGMNETGNNKLYISNSDTATPLIYGDFSTAALTVNGSLKITGNVGFYNTSPAAKPTVSGSKSGNAALASLLTALAGLGLITDSSS